MAQHGGHVAANCRPVIWLVLAALAAVTAAVGGFAATAGAEPGAEAQSTVGFGHPHADFQITQAYGAYWDGWGYHAGVDSSGENGSATIVAMAPGTITEFGFHGSQTTGWGRYAILRHKRADGATVYSVYAHMASHAGGLKVGKCVDRGTSLGVMGKTGNTTGKHLHFEIKHSPGLGKGYYPTHPDNHGYSDPMAYIGSREAKPCEPDQPQPTGADGELIRRPSGEVYVMAGGAPLHFRDREAMQEAGYSWSDVINVSEEYFDSLREYPQDETRLRNHNNGTQFVVAGRAPLKVHGPSAVEPIRNSSGRSLVVADARAIESLPDYPTDRTLLKDHDDADHYVVAGRAGLKFYGTSALTASRQASGRQKVVVDARAIDALPDYPTDETRLRNHNNGTQFVVAGRAPLKVHGPSAVEPIRNSSGRSLVVADARAIESLPDYPTDRTLLKDHDDADHYVVAGRAGLKFYGTSALTASRQASGRQKVVVDARAIDALPDLPSDRTVLKNHNDDSQYVVAGQAPLRIHDRETLDAIRARSGRVTVVADSRRIDDLPSRPNAGTEVEGHPSGRYWMFQEDGSVVSISSTENAVLVDDQAVEAFPTADSDDEANSNPSGGGEEAGDDEVADEQPADETGDDEVSEEAGVFRVGGSTRFSTAAQLSQKAYPDGTDTVYVSTGLEFVDALAGGVIAAQDQAPMLLATLSTLPQPTVSELERLQPQRIVILGGTAAVGRSVEEDLSVYADEVDRLAGTNRFGTAVSVSQAAFGKPDSVDTAFLATGGQYADALASVSAAAKASAPLLLSSPREIPEDTAAELERLDVDRIVLVGGTSALGEEVEAAAQQWADHVLRLAGPTRFATAAEIARSRFGANATEAYVATGLDFADALAAGAIAGADRAPVLLAAPTDLTPASGVAIRELDLVTATLLGGKEALSGEVETQLRNLLSNTSES